MSASDEDPIVEEIHRARERIAAAHGHDARAIVSALRAAQAEHADLVVSRKPKRLAEDTTSAAGNGRRPTTE